MEIKIKPDSEDADPNKLYNLLRNGLGGRYVLRSATRDKVTGEVIFKFSEKSE